MNESYIVVKIILFSDYFQKSENFYKIVDLEKWGEIRYKFLATWNKSAQYLKQLIFCLYALERKINSDQSKCKNWAQ